MRLLTGPAGSGKTSFVLECLRDALGRKDPAIRLLVPTATMAQHLQNRLAREGFVFSPALVQTLSGFVDEWAADVPQAPDAVLYLIVEQAVERARPARIRAGGAHAGVLRVGGADHRGVCVGGLRQRAPGELPSGSSAGRGVSGGLPGSGSGIAAARPGAARAPPGTCGGAYRARGDARNPHHPDGWIPCAAGSGTGGDRGTGAAYRADPHAGGCRPDRGGARAAAGDGLSRRAHGALAAVAGAGAGEGAGNRARSGRDRAAHSGAGRGGTAVSRDGHRGARRRHLCAGAADDPRALRHPGAVLLRRGPGTASGGAFSQRRGGCDAGRLGPRADAGGAAAGASLRGFGCHGPLRFRRPRADSQRGARGVEIAAGGAGGPAALGGRRAAAAQDRFAGVDRRVALVRAGPQGLGGAA